MRLGSDTEAENGTLKLEVAHELQVTRSITPRDKLSRFFRSQSRWELLLLVANGTPEDEVGIWNYIDMLATRTESQMTIYHFIKDRIDDGSFILISGRKRSRKVIALSDEMRNALALYLTNRYRHSLPPPPHGIKNALGESFARSAFEFLTAPGLPESPSPDEDGVS